MKLNKTDLLAPERDKIKRIILDLDGLGHSETCPFTHRSTLTSLIQHPHMEILRVRGSGSPDNPAYRGNYRGYLSTDRAGVVQRSNAGPAEGLLCGDAIITTTLPLSIYSSQSSPSLSLPPISLCLFQSLCHILHTRCQMYSKEKFRKKQTLQLLVSGLKLRNTAPVHKELLLSWWTSHIPIYHT